MTYTSCEIWQKTSWINWNIEHYLIASWVEENPSYFLHLKEYQATPQLLDAVSDRIANQYIHLGLELGLSFDKILQCKTNYPNHTMKVVREILGEWLNNNRQRDMAGIGRLAEALLRSGCAVEPLIEFVDQKLAKQSPKTSVEADVKRRASTKCLIM